MKRLLPHQIKPSTTNGDRLATIAGVTTWASAGMVSHLIPLTTKIGSTPDFVWDANDELVLMEVTL